MASDVLPLYFTSSYQSTYSPTHRVLLTIIPTFILTSVLHASSNTFHGEDKGILKPWWILSGGIEGHQL